MFGTRFKFRSSFFLKIYACWAMFYFERLRFYYTCLYRSSARCDTELSPSVYNCLSQMHSKSPEAIQEQHCHWHQHAQEGKSGVTLPSPQTRSLVLHCRSQGWTESAGRSFLTPDCSAFLTCCCTGVQQEGCFNLLDTVNS